jgi:hypothetical protein
VTWRQFGQVHTDRSVRALLLVLGIVAVMVLTGSSPPPVDGPLGPRADDARQRA